MRRRALVLAAVVLITGAGAMDREPHAPRAPVRHEIRMRAVAFTPNELSVAVGDTVVWLNSDIVRHSATWGEVFDTGELQAGATHAWVPGDTGTYRYRCSIHPRMRGLLVVAP